MSRSISSGLVPEASAVAGRIVSPVLVLVLGVLSLVLSGCTQSRTVSTPVAAPDSFSASGTAEVPDRWWTAFGDADLNAAVDTALARNFTLLGAFQRLRAAQAVVDRESAALLPDLQASASGSVTETGGSGDDQPPPSTLRLGLSSVYEIDLWGRIRSRVDAEAFRADATRSDYQAAALSVSAEVTGTWVRLAEARAQADLASQQVETNETVLDLLENRLGTGQTRGVDVLRQRQLVEATREQRSRARERVAVLEHQLAVLQGRSPQRSGAGLSPAAALPELPPLPAAGVPTDLLQRRPDVQSAFRRLRAADSDLAAAISDQYPRFTLTASSATAADNAQDLFENWAASLAGDLFAPLFFGGELRAEVDRAEAVKQQRLYEYGQTILVALREVEDALVRERRQRERLQQIDEQVALAQRSYEQLRVQYLNGTSGYLDVLTALTEVQQLRRDRLTARRTLLDTRIALYRALAGAVEGG